MFAQTDRPLILTSPLGSELFVAGIRGREAVSELFEFELDTYWQGSGALAFDALLGKSVTVSIQLTDGFRYINGMVASITQVERDQATHYRLQVVPSLWFLTRRAQSRIFQQETVPDIVKAVFSGLKTDYKLQADYKPREYCVQYRESDFAFASRLMEEEGIFYFFRHADGDHTLVVSDNPQVHEALPVTATLPYQELLGLERSQEAIFQWTKSQFVRSGKYTVRDSNFQVPANNYERSKPAQNSVTVGTVTHNTLTSVNSDLELYDYPGDFAQRFDGIDSGGGEQAAKLNDSFADGDRTIALRIKEETARSLLIHGQSNHGGMIPGFKFTLSDHFTDNGDYVLIGIDLDASQPTDTGQATQPYRYENRFTAIPAALPYSPPRVTPEPVVRGVQTAIVVGNSGDEIAVDKYGRVKVQFPWDRQGQKSLSSSCWLRVATFWAGKQWGAVHIPRVGQEVIVDFLEGDPDHPIIVGSVYNADNMPPYTLPDNKTQSGIKSRSSLGGGASNYNEFRFEDKKGSEEILLHAEKDLTTEVEHDENRTVGNNRTTTIQVDETKTVHGKETTTIDGNQALTITQGNQTNELKMGNQSTTLDVGNQSVELKAGNQSTDVKIGKIDTSAMQSITLTVGGSSITIDQMGVTIKGMMLNFEGNCMTTVKADAMLTLKGGITMIN